MEALGTAGLSLECYWDPRFLSLGGDFGGFGWEMVNFPVFQHTSHGILELQTDRDPQGAGRAALGLSHLPVLPPDI